MSTSHQESLLLLHSSSSGYYQKGNSVGEDVEKRELSYNAGGKCKFGTVTMENSKDAPQKFKNRTTI